MNTPTTVGPTTTSVLLGLVEMATDGTRLTIDSVTAHTGLRRSTVYRHLRVLRQIDLVDWAPGRQGTLTLRAAFAEPRAAEPAYSGGAG